ncbi:hypothetical protein M407DRAFT_242108 [Tulasnella calospora MUT 4182]|uniref:Uncharacterized protein n=1 Tax=Tulasnella calospora MUT 4182 TaxID=1051891 RepID=A0A0C3LA17_9AGAM|nr:hypothetical protein M407DRAFT_242108 [Tulasnella calospora MUT 4182]
MTRPLQFKDKGPRYSSHGLRQAKSRVKWAVKEQVIKAERGHPIPQAPQLRRTDHLREDFGRTCDPVAFLGERIGWGTSSLETVVGRGFPRRTRVTGLRERRTYV